MKTWKRVLMVVALTGLSAYAFGQSVGQTPEAELQRMASAHTPVVSGGPDAYVLVKLGVRYDQATQVVALWNQSESEDTKNQIHEMVGDVLYGRISPFLVHPQQIGTAVWLGGGSQVPRTWIDSSSNS